MIAIVLSTLALIVSGAATVGTWRQTDLMKDQLVASDRNAGFLKMGEALYTACKTIQDGPTRARKWKIYMGSDGRPAKIPIIGDAEYRISIQDREAYGNKLQDLSFSLSATSLYSVFAHEKQAEFFRAAIQDTTESIASAIDLVDNTKQDLDYVRLRDIGEACVTNITNEVVDRIGPVRAREGAIPPRLSAFERKMLEPIRDAYRSDP